nr:RNA-binding cell elongation regulator Jag/EloR [uncultured Sellimonas sp.]
MGEITVSAKTVDDAITEALIQLGVTSDMLEYDVIEKGSSGFLGIGSKQAVIRAWKKKIVEKEDELEELKEEIQEVISEVKADEKAVKPEMKSELKEKKPRKEKKERREKETAEIKEVKETKPVQESKKLAKVQDETIAACEKFLTDVLHAMDMEVKISSRIDEEGALEIVMDGKNMGILIGKRGQTLDSLQYLTNRVANKTQDGYVRVKLDTEDYRRRRKETLENLAKNIAYKVKRTKKPVALEPMNPYERRIIHSALQADRYVTTHSEGEEPYRRVVVTLIRNK